MSSRVSESSFWQKVRKDFPLTQKWVYLDHASAGPVPKPIYENLKKTYWDKLYLGDVCWDEWMQRIEESRSLVAQLINADPSEVAFTASSSDGMNRIADLLPKTGKLVACDLEFPTTTVPWIYRGRKIHWLKPISGVVTPEQYLKAAGKNDVLLSSFIQYQNGLRQDMEAMGKMKQGRVFIANATQGLGCLPVDVKKWKVDFLCGNSYKWFMAGYGGGILYINKRWLKESKPAFVGWRSMRDPDHHDNRKIDLKLTAARVELGCPNFLAAFSLGEMARYFLEIGPSRIEKRILYLTDLLIEGLHSLGAEILSPLESKYRSGILVFKVKNPAKTAARLREKKIYVMPRGGGIRVAPHFYNNDEDIEIFIKNLKKVTTHAF